MSNPSSPLETTLAPGRLLRWNARESVRLRVAAGRVWVTQAHDPDDHFLDAGATLLLSPAAQVLIGAERDGARIRLERASEEGAQVVDRRVVGEAAQLHVARQPGVAQRVVDLRDAAVRLHQRLGRILAQAAR